MQDLLGVETGIAEFLETIVQQTLYDEMTDDRDAIFR